MKKNFQIITLLISLSLIGVIYFQVVWIQSAIKTQKTRYDNEVKNAIDGIRTDLLNKSIEVSGYDPNYANTFDEDAKDYFWERSILLTSTMVSNIISNQLKQNGISLQFDYTILNKMNYAIIKSSDFKKAYLNQSYTAILDNNGSMVLYLHINKLDSYIWMHLWWMIAASALFSMIIIAAFALTVGTIYRQKKLSEMKTDFINNMTHEFKTPIATISLATDALNNSKVKIDTVKIEYFTSIIKDENKRMQHQVEKILEAAQLESNQIELNNHFINLHDILHKAIQNINLSLHHKNGRLIEQLNASKPIIWGDEVHIANVFNNLLENAVKYTSNTPLIIIETYNVANKIFIKIKDNGIGMTKETLAHIFEKFYRAHTGNKHNVKGFGLGLSYVKTIVTAHKGKIKAESTVSKGSTFVLEFQLYNKNT